MSYLFRKSQSTHFNITAIVLKSKAKMLKNLASVKIVNRQDKHFTQKN